MAFEKRFVMTALLVLLSAARALAAPSSAERETARSLMIEGDRQRTAGELQKALESFQAAHAIMHVPTTGLALAETQAALGLLVEARSTALELVRQTASDGEPAVFASARRSAAALAAKLEPRVSTLETSVTPSAAVYTLKIDDTTVPSAARSAPFKLNPGQHTVRVTAPGFRPQTRDVVLSEGLSEQLHVELVRDAPDDDAQEQITAAPTPALTATPRDDDPGHGARVRGAIALSLGGAALAAGVVTGTWSWITTHDERARCDAAGQCDPTHAAALSRANTLANVANVTVPVGLLGIAYGLYELLSAPSAPTEQARAAVSLQLTAQGMQLRGAL